jgi:uncharacterized repeat protein (TIGR03803 family)
VLAIHTLDILKKNEVVAMVAIKGFHWPPADRQRRTEYIGGLPHVGVTSAEIPANYSLRFGHGYSQWRHSRVASLIKESCSAHYRKLPMKIFVENLFFLVALAFTLDLILERRVMAQTFTNLHSFTGVGEGSYPHSGLILSSNVLYGTTQNGGNSDYGTVFAVNADGTGFTNLHSFAGGEGVRPAAGLILSGNTLYGTAQDGGSWEMARFSRSKRTAPALLICIISARSKVMELIRMPGWCWPAIRFSALPSMAELPEPALSSPLTPTAPATQTCTASSPSRATAVIRTRI